MARTARKTLNEYRGLIYKTATLQVGRVEEDFEDIVQILSIKVWRAIELYDPARDRGKGQDSYVFSAVTCAVTDLRKRKRHHAAFGGVVVHLEDEAPAARSADNAGVKSRDKFELENGLVALADDVFFDVEDEPVPLPSTLTQLERAVVALLVVEWTQADAARHLGMTPREMEKVMKSVRRKMADWAPSSPAIAGPHVAVPLVAA